MCLCVCVSVSLLELVVPLVKINVKNNNRSGGQPGHEKPANKWSEQSNNARIASLLLVVRQRQTSNAGVAGREGVEQSQVEGSPDLSKVK